MPAPVSSRFPDFPWDTIVDAKAAAAAHPGGIVDLSVGTPVDDAPRLAQDALCSASNSPGYPTVLGPESLRQAAAGWLERRFAITGVTPDAILPTVGSKEFIGNLPLQLGFGPGDTVAFPTLAYPTYEVGARYAGCTPVAADSTVAFGPAAPQLLYLNSPANPHGQVLGTEHLRKVVEWCRERGTLLVSDECYLEFVWEGEPASILHPEINGGSLDGILAVHSLSKRSNLAGYRDAFVVGDRGIIAELLTLRKHLGFMLPRPVAVAMEAALGDDTHVDEQRARYAARRRILRAALEGAGFEISHSEGSLYLWATRGESCRSTVGWLAQRGILVAPGDFYGPAGAQHVRVAFTATDERVAAAAERLA
ncbi:succinyldiaminopimelate transaminase [Aeromicrobium sp. PE09-221]|uniref:succinyldiaminopimelate transaminase n=1 Tax=Aeromicrobium sp. PE09-221 TaxID=1898043 RepID=UPI000B752E12|nr:succinyldiaminopimelate transaminase [Aeromicrobium sp. PE09-221]OUZ12786.1 succinyldiaminopimelate transaminase [Aeromicrobium sp. PE09-221]